MDKKSEKKPTPAQAKQQLEAIAGGHPRGGATPVFSGFRSAPSTYTSGSSAWRSIIIFQQPALRCADANLLDASGLSTTGANGQVTFLLSNFVCLQLVRAFSAPISIVATARSTSPFFVTTTCTLVPDPNRSR